MPTRPDIVYPVRPGDDNPELRHSLRSLAVHYPDHGTVWMVGHKPGWVRDVQHLPGNDTDSAQVNLWRNLVTAMNHPDVGDDVVIMNDDFYITTALDVIPTLYRGRLAEHLGLARVQRGEAWWRNSLNATLVALQTLGHTDPISYELHVPFPVDKSAMADTLARFAAVTPDNPPQWRTLHGNLHNIDGTKHEDCKAYRAGPMAQPFHSTDDRTFRYFRVQLDEMFPQPSPYERDR